MQKVHDIFGPGSNREERVVREYTELKRRVEACQLLGLKTMLLSGTFDLYHEGHARYLERAKELGDILIVGVDDDAKVQRRKKRVPVNSVEDRMEILCHCRHVDLVFLKHDSDPHWELIRTVRPNVLVATQETYTEEEIRALKEFCSEVMVLPPQAAKSTTAILRLILMRGLDEVEREFDAATSRLKEIFKKLRGGAA